MDVITNPCCDRSETMLVRHQVRFTGTPKIIKLRLGQLDNAEIYQQKDLNKGTGKYNKARGKDITFGMYCWFSEGPTLFLKRNHQNTFTYGFKYHHGIFSTCNAWIYIWIWIEPAPHHRRISSPAVEVNYNDWKVKQHCTIYYYYQST